MTDRIQPENGLRRVRSMWLVGASLIFIASALYGFWALELDGAVDYIRGTSFGDSMGWATSARNKFLYGVFSRPYLDKDFCLAVPLHTVGAWLGYEVFGLSLTGLRAFPFFLMLLGKLAFCRLIWRQLGIRYLPWVLVFVSVFLPFLLFSRMGNPEAGQLGLLIITLYVFFEAHEKRSRVLFFLSGLLMGLTFFHKTHLVFLPLFPALFFIIRHYWAKHSTGSLKQSFAGALPAYAGFVLVVAVYIFFWLLPNMGNYIHFMLLGMGYVPPLSVAGIANHLPDLMLVLNPDTSIFLDAHALWLFAPIIFAAVISQLDRSQIKTADVISLAYGLSMLLQAVYTYGLWQRLFTLLPVGCYAVFRLADLIIHNKSLIWKERLNPLRWCLIAYGMYLLGNKAVQLAGGGGKWPFVISALMAMPLAWGFVRLARSNRRIWALSLLMLLVVCSLGSWRHSYDYFADRQSIIRDSSLQLKSLGGAKTFGLYQYSLYNRIDDSFPGSHSSSNQPIDFRWAASQGLTMKQLAQKYRFRSIWAFAIWMAGELDPQLYGRWSLSPDYKTKYQGDVFITPPPSSSTPSRSYLVVGSSRPDLYMTQGRVASFEKYGSKVPYGELFMEIRTRPNYGQKPGTAKIIKVTGWEPNPRRP